MRPVLRWAGSKRQLAEQIRAAAPASYERYFEPFLGSAAALLALPEHESYVSDKNPELVNFYLQLRADPAAVLQVYDCWPNDKEFYLWLRARDREPDFADSSPVLRAARLLYLNKAAFQGLYRVNSAGHHNVPYGRPKSLKVDPVQYAAFAERISRVDIRCCDFDELLAGVRKGDFAYLDSPYVPISPTSGFTTYAGRFGPAEHVRLRDRCLQIDAAGGKFLQSNSDCEEVRRLYAGFRIDTVQVRRSIAARSASRKTVTEVLIRNY